MATEKPLEDPCAEKTVVAFRILAAVTQKLEPEAGDVALICEYCPEERGRPADEIARIVILAALKQKIAEIAARRQKSTGEFVPTAVPVSPRSRIHPDGTDQHPRTTAIKLLIPAQG